MYLLIYLDYFKNIGYIYENNKKTKHEVVVQWCALLEKYCNFYSAELCIKLTEQYDFKLAGSNEQACSGDRYQKNIFGEPAYLCHINRCQLAAAMYVFTRWPIIPKVYLTESRTKCLKPHVTQWAI